jgi:hypothetical protein
MLMLGKSTYFGIPPGIKLSLKTLLNPPEGIGFFIKVLLSIKFFLSVRTDEKAGSPLGDTICDRGLLSRKRVCSPANTEE